MKKMYWICATLFCFFLSTVPSHAELPALSGGAMLSCSGMPCVDVTLKNGKHLKMLVDLGDSNSIVDSAVASEMGLTVTPVDVTDGHGKLVPNYGVAVLEGASLGSVPLGNVQVLVANLAPKIQKGSIPQADGRLSYAAFQDRLLQIDYKHQTVRISQPLSAAVPCAGSCGNITTPTFGKGGPKVLVTTGFAVNGKPVTAQIDTLYTGTMLIYPAAVAKLDLQTESSANPTLFFKYTDGGVAMRESHAKVESFDGKALAHNSALFFATPQVHVPDGMFDGTVGAGLLTGHVVYLDLHSQHFWMTN